MRQAGGMALAEYVLLPLRGLRAAGRSASGAGAGLPGHPARGRPARARAHPAGGRRQHRRRRAPAGAGRARRRRRACAPSSPACAWCPCAGTSRPAAATTWPPGSAGPTPCPCAWWCAPADGTPVPGAEVIAVVDARRDLGATAFTDRRASPGCACPGAPHRPPVRVHRRRLLVAAAARRADGRRGGVRAAAHRPARLDDGLRHFLGHAGPDHGAGVRVGILDTGIDASHPDLRVAGGRNTVTGEDPADHGDNGEAHGTHVAGIVAARGAAPTGWPAWRPAASLYSYRVFGRAARAPATSPSPRPSTSPSRTAATCSTCRSAAATSTPCCAPPSRTPAPPARHGRRRRQRRAATGRLPRQRGHHRGRVGPRPHRHVPDRLDAAPTGPGRTARTGPTTWPLLQRGPPDRRDRPRRRRRLHGARAATAR